MGNDLLNSSILFEHLLMVRTALFIVSLLLKVLGHSVEEILAPSASIGDELIKIGLKKLAV